MPDMVALDDRGDPRRFGSRRHYCFSHQGYRAECARIAEALGPRKAVILQNHGWSSIGALSESHGSQRFGTKYRMRDEKSGMLDGDKLPFDIPANIRSYGLEVQEVSDTESFREAYRRAEQSEYATAIVVNTNLYGPNPPGIGWWDVPVSQVSDLDTTRAAYDDYARRVRRWL